MGWMQKGQQGVTWRPSDAPTPGKAFRHFSSYPWAFRFLDEDPDGVSHCCACGLSPGLELAMGQECPAQSPTWQMCNEIRWTSLRMVEWMSCFIDYLVDELEQPSLQLPLVVVWVFCFQYCLWI